MNERIRTFSEFLAEQEQQEYRALGIEPGARQEEEPTDDEEPFVYSEESDDAEPRAEERIEQARDGAEEFLVSDEEGEVMQEDELDALFARLMAAAQPSNVPSQDAPEQPTKSDVEARLDQMQAILAQTVQALQHTTQMINAQTETEAFRMVARSLQSEGIILSDEQLRAIWGDAQAKGIPPSLAIKAAAYDYLATHRNARLGEMARSEPRFPFLAPRPRETEVRPNEFRKFSDYLRENG